MHPRNASIAISQAYQSAKGARAVSRRKAKRSTPATYRYTDPAHNAIVIVQCRGQAFVTILYSLTPIESTVPRSTIRHFEMLRNVKNCKCCEMLRNVTKC